MATIYCTLGNGIYTHRQEESCKHEDSCPGNQEPCLQVSDAADLSGSSDLQATVPDCETLLQTKRISVSQSILFSYSVLPN